MIYISKQYSFDSTHQLRRYDWDQQKNWDVFGKCSRQHGHTYYLEVMVGGALNLETGMIINYFDLDKIVKPIVDDRLDHINLNLLFPKMLTTAENLVEQIANWLLKEIDLRYDTVSVERVTLQETLKTKAIWTP